LLETLPPIIFPSKSGDLERQTALIPSIVVAVVVHGEFLGCFEFQAGFGIDLDWFFVDADHDVDRHRLGIAQSSA
jgi:hypothetical protein